MLSRKLLMSHPTGNANVRAVAEGLARAQMLYKFYTTIATFEGDLLYKLGGISFLKDLRRRKYPPVLKPYTRTCVFYELGRRMASKASLASLTLHEKGMFSVDSVYSHLDKKVASVLPDARKKGIAGVYAYEDGALDTFKVAKKLGLKCLYDLPIGYWRESKNRLGRERELKPEWSATITALRDSDEKLARKDEELLLADHIFVASSFTAQTLKSYPGKLPRVDVIPYGFPPVFEGRKYTNAGNRKLKVLFVGGLSQRKGIAYLFEMADKLQNKIELTIVGHRAVDNCDILNKNLDKHKWYQSLPHKDILELMRTQDVFVFPSLFEGFGLVITEAMSQGTPVITTECTVGPDFIRSGDNGWLVESGSSEGLIHRIEEILSKPDILESVGKSSLQTAARRPWKVYSEDLVEALQRKLDE